MIQGRQKKILQTYFQKAGVPWIYDAEKPEIHATSSYNKKPKGTKFRNNFETRLATIRNNLSNMDERIDKYRTDRLTNKKPTLDEQHMMAVYKALASDVASGQYKAQNAAKQRQAQKAADAAIGIEPRKGSPVKKVGGSSKGGVLSKKLRETSALSGEYMASNIKGGGAQ